MAISKILHIGDCGARHSGRHLRCALNYIMDPQKTGGGEWIGALNCQSDNVYRQMRRTKADFGKTDKRQGYHLIISFEEGEVDAGTAFEVIGRFAKEYLGWAYEALYTVHDNTEHIHGHIIFNSVSFRDGKKYRYEKGDWAKKIQPITNRLCREYGLSTIEISEDRAKPFGHYKEWNDFRDGKFVWKDMIKRDIDACILQAPTYESFLSMLADMGYAVKNAYPCDGKYLAIKPMGLTRFKRCESLGENYSRERIEERILSESVSQNVLSKAQPQIVRCRVKRYRKAGLSGIQKRYFARLYRTGLLKKRPYSQVWRYRDDIRRMKKLQEDYLFLNRNGIHSVSGIAAIMDTIPEKKKAVSREKSRVYRERARLKPLFDAAEEMKELQACENCFRRGEKIFEKEHMRWQELAAMLQKEGYTLERLETLKAHYRNEISMIRDREKMVVKEERIADRILKEYSAESVGKEKDRRKEVYRNKEDRKQPIK